MNILSILLLTIGAFLDGFGLYVLRSQITNNSVWQRIEAFDQQGSRGMIAPITLFLGTVMLIAGVAVSGR